MNKKSIDDFKFVKKREIKPLVKEEVKAQLSKIEENIISNNNESKYDFLKKKFKKEKVFSRRISENPKLPKRNKFSTIILVIFIASLLVGGLYAFSTVFLHANVLITAKNKTFELKDQKFTASKKGNSIPFELMIVQDIYSKDVVLTSSKEVSIKATGEITLYNEYSNKSQKITAGAFVSDEKGKSYKINSTVTIPGYTLDKSKKLIPGTVNVGITSFLAGEAYNGSPEKFNITSFKGKPQYNKIYGKLKTPLTGGMVGQIYVLDDKQKESILSETDTFKAELMRKLKAQVPEGYILYGDATSFKYDSPEEIKSKTPNAKVEMKGTLSAFLIKEKELSSAVIDKLLPNISKKERSEILPPDLSKLSFGFVSNNQAISKEVESFDFKLNNSLVLNWKPDVYELQRSLVGMEKERVPLMFKEDPAISSATVTIVPFWSKTLPENKKSIHIRLE